MKVEKLKLYRIVPFEEQVNVGDSIIPHKWENKRDFKKQIENALECYRPKYFPRRDLCLYVCFSKENAFEWARIKYSHKNTSYKLLTLEVTGELYWFSIDCYNFLREESSQEEFHNACSNYWSSMKENINDLVIDKGYEGLFVGEAKVVDIEYKNYMNFESYNV